MVKCKRFVICTSGVRDIFSFHPKLISNPISGRPYTYSLLSSRLLLPGTQEIEFYFLGGKRKSLASKGQFWYISQSSLCKYLKLVAPSCLTPCNPMDCIVHQDALSMEFSKQEYWSGLPFPSPGDRREESTERGLCGIEKALIQHLLPFLISARACC